MKNVTIAGRIGKEPQLRRTNDGDPVLSFSVAVDDGYGQNKSTIWFDVSVWGKRAAALEKVLTKGTALTVSGDLGMREHNGKTYLTVRANEVTLQGGGKKSEGAQSQESSDDRGSGIGSDMDDEIPF